MSISKQDKEYWVKFLKDELDSQIRVITKERPDFMVQANLVARDNVIDTADISGYIDVLAVVEKEREDIRVHDATLVKERSEIVKQINKNIQRAFPSASEIYDYRNVQDSINTAASCCLQSTIESMGGEIPAEVARLMALKNIVERQMMLANGSAQMTVWIRAFMLENGIK
jgi:hypothetical protein